MEDLQNYILIDAVPPSWTLRAYPSNLGLNSWFADMLNRINELASWTADFSVNFCSIAILVTQMTTSIYSILDKYTRKNVQYSFICST